MADRGWHAKAKVVVAMIEQEITEFQWKIGITEQGHLLKRIISAKRTTSTSTITLNFNGRVEGTAVSSS